jgi:CRISPR-associated protein Csb2
MSLITTDLLDRVHSQPVHVSRGQSPHYKKSPSVVDAAKYLSNSTMLPRIGNALPFAEQVRRTLIRNRVDTSHSEAITGKTVDGVPLEGHEHAHYFATDEDGDGRLDHVTIYCPRGFDEADVETLGSLRTIYRQGNRPDVRMILIGLGGVERFAQRGLQPDLERAERDVSASSHAPIPSRSRSGTWCDAGRDACAPGVFAISKRWRSVTPFSLPRFPNRGAGKPPRPRDLPEAQLIQELAVRGLPEPVSIKRIDGYQAGGRPIVRWLEFHTQRFKGTSGKGLAGFEIEFAEPVAGPIAVGFACHFGLGLFMPC